VIVRWVRNLATGLVFDVPEGHFSLTSGEYEVLEGPLSEPAPEPEPVEPEPAPARRPRKK
jgi:hypothetical protein